jgi:hypothetical protein
MLIPGWKMIKENMIFRVYYQQEQCLTWSFWYSEYNTHCKVNNSKLSSYKVLNANLSHQSGPDLGPWQLGPWLETRRRCSGLIIYYSKTRKDTLAIISEGGPRCIKILNSLLPSICRSIKITSMTQLPVNTSTRHIFQSAAAIPTSTRVESWLHLFVNPVYEQ